MIDGLRLERGAVAEIIFDSPAHANAIRPGWAAAIEHFVGDVAADSEVRCLLIRAEGRHFQAGGDLAAVLDGTPDSWFAHAKSAMASWNRALIAIDELRKPVVAAVQGGTVGASVALVAAADIVIAADDAFFIMAQAKIGASLDGLPSYFLPRRIGLAKSLEWTLLAERIDARAAADAGLVNRIVSRAVLADEAQRLSAGLAAGPTVALGLSKQLLRASARHGVREQAELETEMYAAAVASPDWQEGIGAFLEKRPPRFSGR